MVNGFFSGNASGVMRRRIKGTKKTRKRVRMYKLLERFYHQDMSVIAVMKKRDKEK